MSRSILRVPPRLIPRHVLPFLAAVASATGPISAGVAGFQAPFRVFMIASKAEDHIRTSTAAKAVVEEMGKAAGGVSYVDHPALQNGSFVFEDRTHPVTRNMPASVTIKDEWYEWSGNPRPRVRVLGKADESTYSPLKRQGDHPIFWTNESYPKMIYLGVGHDPSVWSHPTYVLLVRDALMWLKEKPAFARLPKDRPTFGAAIFLAGLIRVNGSNSGPIVFDLRGRHLSGPKKP